MTTQTPTYHNVHNEFRMNGFHLNREDLCRVAYSFIKEGEAFERPVGDFLLDWFDAHDYIEMTTSGTTGTPKTVRIEKQAMVHSALATGDFFGLEPGDRALHCLPVKFIAGKMMLVRAMILGLDIDFVAPNATPLARRQDAQYDFVAMVPLQVQHSLTELRNVKTLIVGGAGISKTLLKALQKLPTQVYETYGMTETITHIAARKVGDKAFTVLPGVTLSYDDNNCLVIHAPRISQDVIHTHDLVQLLSENEFVFLGRADHVINSGGIKIMPEQVEEQLAPQFQSRFFAAGVPDDTLGEKLVLVVEGEAASDALSFESLDKYEKPKAVYYIPQFLMTETGKIKRKETLKAALQASKS